MASTFFTPLKKYKVDIGSPDYLAAPLAVPAGFVVLQADPVDSVNAAHLVEIQSSMDAILRHPTFAGIAGENPLPLGQSSIAPFAKSEYELGMQHGKYSCGFNLFQLNLTFAPCVGVPVNRKGARS
jgi:hypothetical protein